MNIADKFTELNEKISQVHDMGVREGMQKQYDEFWDAYQQNGTRKDYSQAFRGVGWRGTTFKPKYNMTVTNGSYFLYASGVQADPIDLIALEENGLIIDFSQCTKIEAAFSQAPTLVTVGTVDLSSMTGIVNALFSTSRNIRRIKLVKVHKGITSYSSFVKSCERLEEIKIEGNIVADIDFSDCTKLTTESIISIVEALCTDPDVAGKTLSLPGDAVNAMDFNNTNYADFKTLTDTKPNWNIATV